MKMIATTALAALLAFPAQAQAPCMHRPELVETLQQEYGENLVLVGIAGQTGSHLLEVFASPDGGWTAFVTNGGGQSCLVAAGRDLRLVEPPAPGDPM